MADLMKEFAGLAAILFGAVLNAFVTDAVDTLYKHIFKKLQGKHNKKGKK